MPWKEIKPMDQKVLFIADFLRGSYSFSRLCEHFQISRKTGYKWVRRYQELGIEGLQDQSRQPHTCPHRIPYTMRKAIIAIRKQPRRARTPLGAKKIKALLSQRYAEWEMPSETSIHNILKKEGLVTQIKRRKRSPPYSQGICLAKGPNELWSADFKGQFRTKDSTWCFPLTVMDHTSRFLLGCRGLNGIGFLQTKKTFENIFHEYGMPRRIRTDNGTPFASTGAGGLCRLSIWWLRLGIHPERIEPGKPQQNGRHERMHRTLKDETAIPAAATIKQQQELFDTFRHEYNYDRPHESLEQKPPASMYQDSPRHFPKKLPELYYPGHFKTALVHHNGVIHHQGHRVYIAGILKKEKVGIEEVKDGVWEVYFGSLRLGCFNMRDVKTNRNDYLKLKM